MLETENTFLVIIDVQGKLATMMHEKESLFENLRRMIGGAGVMGIPILWTEQNPGGLGPTIPEIKELLIGESVIAKLSFSCCGDRNFMAAMKDLNRKQALITGIETHVCVYQTAADLLDLEYEVHVVSDAVSSRTIDNKKIGLAKMKEAGTGVTGTETVLLELLRTAEDRRFKEILKIIK